VLVKDAKDIARRWVAEQASDIPGYRGALFHGSIGWLPDDALIPALSDVDVMLVLDMPEPPPLKLGKTPYQGLLLDVSVLASDELSPPERILGQYHLAGSFRSASIIADPSGLLACCQAVVARHFAVRRWVRQRCEHAHARVLRNLQSLRESDPLHDQVTAWLFATGVTTHILLVAGLRNPTVRTRYVATRALLSDYGYADFYEFLLRLLGCAELSRADVERHLPALAEAFDAAKAVIATPFPFASDITGAARPFAIDGSQDLMERGFHREAVFWMVATASRCQKVLAHDAPDEVREQLLPGYRQLLGDLGIASFADLQERCDEVRAALPTIREVAEAIMAANPEIVDD